MKMSDNRIKNWFDACSKRERILMAVVVFTLVFALWHSLLYSTLAIDTQEITTEKSAVIGRIRTLSDQYNVLTQRGDSNRKTRRHKARLQQDLSQLNQQLSIFETDLVKTKKLSHVLYSIVKAEKGLALASLESKPPKRLETALNKLQGHPLVKHTMTLTLKGGFFSVYRFLEAIERSPWRIFWDQLDYQVQQYPNATVQLTIHILSRHQDESK